MKLFKKESKLNVTDKLSIKKGGLKKQIPNFNLMVQKIRNKLEKKEVSQRRIVNIIEDRVSSDYNLSGGYSDLISNEEKYMEFVSSLGYEYYSSYSELTKTYKDTSIYLEDEKLELCSNLYVIPLEDKKTKQRVLGLRDIAYFDFEKLNQFYFQKIVILGEDVLASVFGEDREITFGSYENEENDEEIQKYFDKIMEQAILLGASDIHIQKNSRNAVLWYRIDGIKIERGTMPISIARTLKRRLVTMADQEDSDFESVDGIINYEYGKKHIKFRLGLINSKFNFTLTMRMIGGKGVISHNLLGLNYPQETVDILHNLTKYANGMILITGQVGSGKTHLMYALLKQLAKQQQFVITIEDPVEYVDDSFFQIDLSEYSSASDEYKYGYPEAVVDILRQDSNIILIGETREPETAYQLVNASNLGQLVFSTMHTNSATATVSRMVSSLGIKEGDIVDNLRGIVSQRLVRKLCNFCKEEDGEGGYRKVGCTECNETGFKDRVPIAEVARFKIGHGGEFENYAEYMTVERACIAQYKAGFITKEDSNAVTRGEEVWYD